MNGQDALKVLSTIALEYATVQKDRPATQEALLLRIQEAHNVLNATLNPVKEDPEHDRHPT